MAVKFTFLLLAVILSVDLALSQNCGPNPLEDMDELISNITPFGNPKQKAPTQAKDLPGFCSYYRNALKEVTETNKKCIKTGHRAMINAVLVNINSRSKDICSSKKTPSVRAKQQSFLQLGRCIHSGGDKLKQCITTAKVAMGPIGSAPQAQRLPLLCCQLRQMKGCLFTTLTAQTGCDTEQAATKMRDFVATFAGGSLASACEQHTAGNKCASLSPPRKGKGAQSKASKSFLMPVLNVLNSL